MQTFTAGKNCVERGLPIVEGTPNFPSHIDLGRNFFNQSKLQIPVLFPGELPETLENVSVRKLEEDSFLIGPVEGIDDEDKQRALILFNYVAIGDLSFTDCTRLVIPCPHRGKKLNYLCLKGIFCPVCGTKSDFDLTNEFVHPDFGLKIVYNNLSESKGIKFLTRGVKQTNLVQDSPKFGHLFLVILNQDNGIRVIDNGIDSDDKERFFFFNGEELLHGSYKQVFVPTFENWEKALSI